MSVSGSGRVSHDGCCPTIGNRIVSPTGVQIAAKVTSAPNDHFAAGPDRRMAEPGSGSVGDVRGCPSVRAGIVSAAGDSPSAPNDHFAASPHSCGRRDHRRVSCARRYPTVRIRIISAAGVEIANVVRSAPDDHFAAGPNRRVLASGSGRTGGTGRYPTVGVRIVSPASVQKAALADSAPNDHFAASPHSCVNPSADGRVAGTRGCPTIRSGIVPSPDILGTD